jgi:nucleotide-binding universal stress UspA family protein
MVTRILVALDGSEPASRAGALGADLAVKYGAALDLVHVIPRLVISDSIKQFAEIEGVDTREMQISAAAQSFLTEAKGRAAAKGVARVATEVLVGDPAAELLDYARGRSIDLLVLGRRGMGQVRGLLMGSVSSKVSSLASCPVLTVP